MDKKATNIYHQTHFDTIYKEVAIGTLPVLYVQFSLCSFVSRATNNIIQLFFQPPHDKQSFIHWMSQFPSSYFIYKRLPRSITRIIAISQYILIFDKTISSQGPLSSCPGAFDRITQSFSAQFSLNCRCSNLHFRSISRTSCLA